MNTPLSTFDITKEALPDLLLRIHQGKVQLPDLQRDFCWSDNLVIQLLASVSQGWPIGSLLLLEISATGSSTFQPRPVEGAEHLTSTSPTHLILDGQQRATTLYQALYSGHPVQIQSPHRKRTTPRWYYIDLRQALDPSLDRATAFLSLNGDRTRRSFGHREPIDCRTPEQEYEQGLFPLAQVFHFSQWRQQYCQYWQYDPTHLTLIEQFEQRVVKRFEHYQLPLIQLKPELPKPAVCLVFEKTNTCNTELTFFDLATAYFARSNFSLREDWLQREQHLKHQRVLAGVRETDFLSCVTLVATYYRRQKAMQQADTMLKLPAVACDRAEVLDLTVEEYQTYADRVVVGYEAAARFLLGQRMLNPDDLPYSIQLVALAAILTVVGPLSERWRSRLEQWFWAGSCCALYTSWHEVRARRDMVEVPEWLLGRGAIPSTLKEALFTAQSLLRAQRRHGAVYKSVSALIKKHGAIDFATGTSLADVQYFDDPIESHHIFPVAYCKQLGLKVAQYNSLINRTPLSRLSNQTIGGKAPSVYLKALEDHGIARSRLNTILRSHLIEPETLWAGDFDAFFAARTTALMQLVQQAIAPSDGMTEFNHPSYSKREKVVPISR